ncbi:hypothetical protein MCOR28_009895 [Pyricularia oryzae]|nr:hypothetical protein MCOR28_009895 [Pyricularia oryzae]KAI6459921.1 hypothetical protein MCOR15_005743 [Pyricularia oryzae]KAI6528970.1 hypothetical protein MCOR16_005167 [Pyricularia oryzae]KAI6636748.1 hypothetical protein MCOR08_003502 [Pyricularia oryzae]
MPPKRTAILVAAGLLALTAAAPRPTQLAPRSYTRSCQGCYLSDTKYLFCYCSDGGGRRVGTEIDLDWCVANQGGRLVARANGNFSKSCNHERWVEGSTNVLTASCGDGRGGVRDSSINLALPRADDFIHNNNGVLTCHGIKGVEGQVPGGPGCPYPHTIC